MGLQIGIANGSGFDAGHGLTATRRPVQRTAAGKPPDLLGQRQEDESVDPFTRYRARPEPERVGFGRGSVSVPTVTVRTIDRNVESARQAVPTIEETRQRIRERLDEVQQQLTSEAETPERPKFDVTVGAPQAAAQARSFINDVNQAAAAAFARAEGQPAPETSPRVDIRIGDTTAPFLRPTNNPAFNFFA